VGGLKVVRQSDEDELLLVGAGVTLHGCLEAAAQLDALGHPARVVDLYSVKPIDREGLVGRCGPAATASSWSQTTTPRAASARRSSGR
jgi:transketolase